MVRKLMAAFVCLALAGCHESLSPDPSGDDQADVTAKQEQALTGDNSGGTNLGGANLGGANLGGANLGGANLGGANLGGANLGGANLGGANLGGANLGGANLGGANLGGANLGGANLGGANLGGANLAGNNLGGANLGGANLGGANLGGANLGGANLGGANMAGLSLSGTNLGGANHGLPPPPDTNVAGTGVATTTLFKDGLLRYDVASADMGINIHKIPPLPISSMLPGPDQTDPKFDVTSTLAYGSVAGGSVSVNCSGASLMTYSFGAANGGSSRTFTGQFSIAFGPALPSAQNPTPRSIKSVTIFSVKAPNRGKMNVTFDGQLKGTVDLYSATPMMAAVFTISTVSGTGPHVLMLSSTSSKHASSTGYFVDIDSIQTKSTGALTPTWTSGTKLVPGPPIMTSIEAVAGSFVRGPADGGISYQFSGPFTQVASAIASGGTSAVTSHTGPYGSLSYGDQSITGITIYSVKGPDRGIVDIEIDGVVIAKDVDLYSPAPIRQAIFTTTISAGSNVLAPDSHGIVVRNTGLKNTASTAFKVDVDSVETTSAGPKVTAPNFPNTSMLYSGEDLYHARFAGTSSVDDSCVVMGLGSTAFARLVYDNEGSLNAMIGKLPWGFSPSSGSAKTLDAWEVIAYGQHRYCVFIVAAPVDTSYDGVAGYLKAVYRWNAQEGAPLQIGAINGGQPPKFYTGMMGAARRLLVDHSMNEKTFVAGELAFIAATTNNVAVNVDFSSWFSDATTSATRVHHLMGGVSGLPKYLEGAYVAYETASGDVGVMLVPGAKAARGTVREDTVWDGTDYRLTSLVTNANGSFTPVIDSGAEAVRAYVNWLVALGGRCLIQTGCSPGLVVPTPPLPKRCAGARAILQSQEYAAILNDLVQSCRIYEDEFTAECATGTLTRTTYDSIIETGADPILAPILRSKCDAEILSDTTEASWAVQSTNPGSGVVSTGTAHSTVELNVDPSAMVFATSAMSPAEYSYANTPPDSVTVNVSYDIPVYLPSDPTQAVTSSTETVKILAGTYVHLNDSPY